MYEELVQALRHCVFGDCIDCSYRDNCTSLNTKAADAIESTSKAYQMMAEAYESEVTKRDWIPVTARLPECDLGAEVGNIEWISCGMVHAGCFGRGGKYRDAYFRTWTDAGEGMDAKDADYWRAVTLPEPPKEGE